MTATIRERNQRTDGLVPLRSLLWDRSVSTYKRATPYQFLRLPLSQKWGCHGEAALLQRTQQLPQISFHVRSPYMSVSPKHWLSLRLSKHWMLKWLSLWLFYRLFLWLAHQLYPRKKTSLAGSQAYNPIRDSWRNSWRDFLAWTVSPRVLPRILPRLSVRLLARLLARLFPPKSFTERLGSDYMHGSRRDSLRDSFFRRVSRLPLRLSQRHPPPPPPPPPPTPLSLSFSLFLFLFLFLSLSLSTTVTINVSLSHWFSRCLTDWFATCLKTLKSYISQRLSKIISKTVLVVWIWQSKSTSISSTFRVDWNWKRPGELL